MVKLKGPGLAAAASGSLGGQVTFSNWKGKAYLKTTNRPKQPNTAQQIAMRAVMAFLSAQWSSLSAADQATWLQDAQRQAVSPFNIFQAENLRRWRSQFPPTKAWPAAEANDPADMPQITATGAIRHVTLALLLWPPLNDNWTGMLFHQLGAWPALEWQNLIHIHLMDDLTTKYWTHYRLPPGTHYYKMVATSDDGKPNWAFPAQDSAVVTA